MKRLTLSILLILLATTSLQAKHITSNEALQQVLKKTRCKALNGKSATAYQLVYSADEFYAYNNSNKGFVILAADDCLQDLVLGYSDEGTFDYATMPDVTKDFLKDLNEEVALVAAINSLYPNRTSSTLEDLDPIEPLTKSKWNQNSPWNLMVPTNASGAHYNAGCVPIAMSQVMFYHKWPLQGTGSNSYSWDMDGTESSLSMDFSKSTYDWDNICSTYSNASTTEQQNAVAKLLLDCGIAVFAEYRSGNTGANIESVIKALMNYFDYDQSLTCVLREYYTKREWRDLLYDNLKAGLPIYYRGKTQSGDGHAFVCDGYKDGLFHINWGWGGMSDGYFQIALLDPAEQGLGGSTAGYQCGQKAILGIHPNTGGEAVRLMYNTGDFSTTPLTSTTSTKVCFTGSYVNESSITNTYAIGIKIEDAEGNATYLSSTNFKNKKLARNDGLVNMYIQMSDASLTEGTYKITPAYAEPDTDNWVEMPTLMSAAKPYIIATVDAEGNITFSYPTNDTAIKATNIAPRTRIIAGYDTDIDFTVTNTGTEYLNNVSVALLDSGTSNIIKKSSDIFIDVDKDEEASYNATITNPETAGSYELVLLDASGNIVSDRIEVTAEEAPSDSLAYKGTLKATSTAINDLVFNLNLQCTSGVFNNKITIFIYTSGLTEVGSIPGTSRTFLVEGDDPIDVTFTGAFDLNVGKYYTAMAYFPNPGWEEIAKRTFKASAASGIESIYDNSNNAENENSYNVLGQKISSAGYKGIIIKNGKKYLNK